MTQTQDLDTLRAVAEGATDLLSGVTYVYDRDNWESTHDANDLCYITDESPIDQIVTVGRLVEMPPVFAANVPVSWDEDGDPEDWEWRLFATHAEALAARTALQTQEDSLG